MTQRPPDDKVTFKPSGRVEMRLGGEKYTLDAPDLDALPEVQEMLDELIPAKPGEEEDPARTKLTTETVARYREFWARIFKLLEQEGRELPDKLPVFMISPYLLLELQQNWLVVPFDGQRPSQQLALPQSASRRS